MQQQAVAQDRNPHNLAPMSPMVAQMSTPQNGSAIVVLAWSPGTNQYVTADMVQSYEIDLSSTTTQSNIFLWHPTRTADTFGSANLPSGKTSYVFLKQEVNGWFGPRSAPFPVTVPPDGIRPAFQNIDISTHRLITTSTNIALLHNNSYTNDANNLDIHVIIYASPSTNIVPEDHTQAGNKIEPEL